jgi:ABC-type phosphate transport system substrate-binding protein
MSRRAFSAHLAAVITVLLNPFIPAAAQSPARSQAFVVVVHADNPVEGIDREALSNLFLKRSTKWPAGNLAEPVDQSTKSSAREAFSRSVLRKSVTAVRTYWQQQIFSGRDVPPREKASDAEVLDAVKATPNAVGYVAASTALPAGVKILIVRD